MSSKAVKLWQACLQKLHAATDAASPADAKKAARAALLIAYNVQELNPLPSAIIKKLVKDAKVVQLLCKAFNESTQNGPLSPATAAASTALWIFLLQAQAAGAWSSSPLETAQQRGAGSSLQNSNSSSSGRPFSNLAAEVRRQLQDSGLQQQLTRTMDAVAQQLEADAANPAALAAWWQEELFKESALLFSTKQTLALLSIKHMLLSHTPDDTLFWLQNSAGSAAAHLSLSVLRFASALMQQLAPPSGSQLTLTAGQCAENGMVTELFGGVSAAWNACSHLQLAACSFARAADPQHTSGMFASTHMFELNVASTAVVAQLLQHASSQAPNTHDDGSSSSSSGSSSSSSSRMRSTATSQQLAATGDSTDSAVRAWIQAHQQAASLTPLQQQLWSQLGVDARVLLWAVQTASVKGCGGHSTLALDVHISILTLWRQAGRLWWLQQPEQQQQQQQQPAGPLQHELHLHLLLQCVTLPCCLAVVRSSGNTESDLSELLAAWTELLPQSTHSLSILPMNLAAAAGSQAFPMHAWLQDVLQSLLLLSAELVRGRQERQQQQQHGSGAGASAFAVASGSTVSSSSSRQGAQASTSSSSMLPNNSAASPGLLNPAAVDPAGTAAALCMVFGLAEVFRAVCAGSSEAVAPPAFAQWQGQGSAAAADTACTLQPAYAALLQHQTTAILAQLDSCIRAAHRCAAAGADSGSSSIQAPKTLSSQAFVLGLQLLCDRPGWGPRPMFALLMWAQQAGPGSKEQRQLYSLLASLLKLCGDSCVVTGDDAEQLELARCCRHGAAEAAGMLLLDDVASSSSNSSAAAAAEGTGAVHAEQHAAGSAVQLLPSLVIFGRACLQWAQELQLQTADTASQETAAAATSPLDDFSALGICCGWLSPSTEHSVGPTSTASTVTSDKSNNRLSYTTERFHAWLSKQHITAQVVAAGYDPHSLIQQLELLKQAAATAAAAVAAATSQQPPALAQAVQPLVQQLQAVGAATSTFAVQAFCNNLSCTNISGPTEQQLVSGRSCICAGCRTARFCSRACLKQHWKAHKPVCQALAAAAAAAEAAANVEPAGVGSG